MKKKLSLVLAVLLTTAMVFTGCGKSEDTSANKTENKPVKEIKVGVALYKFDDTFISTVRDAIEAEAKAIEQKDGVKITINAVDGQGQQAMQNDQIDTFITQKYDVICVNMVDRTAASVVIDKAKAANIPVVFFNREPVKEDMAKWDKLFYVGAKAEESGTIQGQIIADYWKKHPEADKNKDGKVQYVMLEGEPGHQDAILRTEYSIKALEDAGLQVEKLASDTANWQRAQGQDKMSAFLSAHPNVIEVVFSNNDDMALGAIEALKAAGYFKDNKFMPVVGVDASAPARDSIKQNLLLGSALNDSKGQGAGVMDIAYAIVKGEDVASTVKGMTDGKYMWVPYQRVTKENVDKFSK